MPSATQEQFAEITSAPRGETPQPDDRFAARLRGFGLVGILAILVIYFGNAFSRPLGTILILLWVWASHTPWREIGFVKPKNWFATLAGGAVFGCALKLAMKAFVMPLFFHADPINWAFHFLDHNRAALPQAIYMMIVSAGIGEEMYFRGYFFERFGKLFGTNAAAKILTVLISSAWFGYLHYAGQGLPGVEQAAIVGLIFGTIFALNGQIFVLMAAHAAFDLTALTLIYFGLETKVAHLIFH